MKGIWYRNIADGDSLEILSGEKEELENDELSVGEAGFLQGYEEDAYEPYYDYEG